MRSARALCPGVFIPAYALMLMPQARRLEKVGFMELAFVFWGIVLLAGLGMLSWIDARTLRLPDVLTLPLVVAGLAQAWLLGGDTLGAAIGAAMGYLFFVCVETVFRKVRGKEGLGRGDAKLLAAGGAWCGWMGLTYIVLIASGAGLVFAGLRTLAGRRADGMVPFGPFLALGIAAVWFAKAFAVLP